MRTGSPAEIDLDNLRDGTTDSVTGTKRTDSPVDTS
jgi:hypothetical protein